MILTSRQLLRRSSWTKDASVEAECTPDGCKLYDVYSLSVTTLITRSNIVVRQVDAPTWCSFELSEWILISGSSRIRLAIFYIVSFKSHRFQTLF